MSDVNGPHRNQGDQRRDQRELGNGYSELNDPVEQRARFEDEQAAKDAGRMRAEGRDYVVADGDVILFRFNV